MGCLLYYSGILSQHFLPVKYFFRMPQYYRTFPTFTQENSVYITFFSAFFTKTIFENLQIHMLIIREGLCYYIVSNWGDFRWRALLHRELPQTLKNKKEIE